MGGERGAGRSGTFTVVAVVGALTVGMLAGGAGVTWIVGGDALAGGLLTAQEGPQASDVIDEVLPGLIAFVEQERELSFDHEVEVEVLADDEFETALFAPSPTDGEETAEPEDYAATYEALGLTLDADHYYDAEAADAGATVTGFYDYETKRLVVRGTEWTPIVEATVVHELTHALQDQHFSMAGFLDTGWTLDDAAIAARGLVEGDAYRVEGAYVSRQDAEWQSSYYEPVDTYDPTGAYDAFAVTLGWMPYQLGATAVDTIFVAGGNAAVDQAFRSPPTTSEELALTQDYLDGTAEVGAPEAVAPATPPDGYTVVDQGTLGAAVLTVLPLALEGGVDYYDGEVLDGWRGDGYTTWSDGSMVCTSLTIYLDDDAVAPAQQQLAPWTVRTGGTIEVVQGPHGGTGLELYSCGT